VRANQSAIESRRRAVCLTIATLLVGLSALAGPLTDVTATPESGYLLDWWTVDGGGRTGSIGEGYTLSDTVGQPDAGLMGSGDDSTLPGTGYTLGGGFWGGGAVAAEQVIYLPFIMRGPP